MIKDLLKYKTSAPSKTAYKAGRCICLLLNAFYGYSDYKECTFKKWDEIRSFL